MSAAVLLERLDGVRQKGASRWIARCPSHEDRTPSLSIRELNDGRVLVHDFGGCATADVLAAVGLTASNLFPERHDAHQLGRPTTPQHWHASREAMLVMHFEVLVVVIAANDIAGGRHLSASDADRVALAAGRIRTAIEACQ